MNMNNQSEPNIEPAGSWVFDTKILGE